MTVPVSACANAHNQKAYPQGPPTHHMQQAKAHWDTAGSCATLHSSCDTLSVTCSMPQHISTQVSSAGEPQHLTCCRWLNTVPFGFLASLSTLRIISTRQHKVLANIAAPESDIRHCHRSWKVLVLQP